MSKLTQSNDAPPPAAPLEAVELPETPNATNADVAVEGAPESGPTPEEIEAWRVKAAKADEHWDRLLRVTADFDNFKKRAAREKQEAVKYANESLMQKLLPSLDHFDMALTATAQHQAESLESLKAGIALVYQQLRSTLAEAGLEEIIATQQPFDPTVHEAVSQQETLEVPEGHVAQQLRKGYKLRDRLLRPAMVVVAKPPAT